MYSVVLSLIQEASMGGQKAKQRSISADLVRQVGMSQYATVCKGRADNMCIRVLWSSSAKEPCRRRGRIAELFTLLSFVYCYPLFLCVFSTIGIDTKVESLD